MDTVDPHPSDWRARLNGARRDRRVRSLLLALAAGLILMVLIAATNSVTASARSISSDASALSRTDESIRAATVARTLTTLAAVAANEGTAAPSLDEIRDALDVVRGDLAPETVAFRDATDDIVATLETGATPLPEQIARVENTYGTMLDAQLTERERLADALAASEQRMNQIASLAGLALLFVVPTVAIGVYRAITRPDMEHEAMASAAAVANTVTTNRLAAVADAIASLRNLVPLAPPPVVTDQRLAEINALAGVGADGRLRRRSLVDVRTAAASAVNRVELTEAVPITGRAPAASVDEEQFVAMLASLVGILIGRRAPAITIDTDGTDATVRITCADVIEDLHQLTTADLFHERIDGVDAGRVTAARSLAADLGIGFAAVDADGRNGFELRFADVATMAEAPHAPVAEMVSA